MTANYGTAPRVTLKDIDENIVSSHFFTADEGLVGHSVLNNVPKVDAESTLSLLTFCVLVLRNGFTVTGESACVSVENFNAELGRTIAKENAKQKLWSLMGYALKTQTMSKSNE